MIYLSDKTRAGRYMYLKSMGILIVLGLAVTAAAEPISIDGIKKSLESVLPEVEVSDIRVSKIPGLYQVMIGAEIFYVSSNGQYLLRGDLFDLANKVNLSEQDRTIARASILSEIPEGDYIEYAPEKPGKAIYVFTDVTCPYCQKLQADVPALTGKGLTVRFLAFPRNGAGTPAFSHMESVWCSANRNQALTEAMAGKTVAAARCENPVEAQFALGQALGVRGTPAIYTDDGRLFAGYMPPDELVRVVNDY